MPFTRPPLEYPICRLFLRVGLAFQTALVHLDPVPVGERPAMEVRLARFLELPAAEAAGLLRSWQFCWSRAGVLRSVRLHPVDHLRRTPGLAALNALYFRPLVPR